MRAGSLVSGNLDDPFGDDPLTFGHHLGSPINLVPVLERNRFLSLFIHGMVSSLRS